MAGTYSGTVTVPTQKGTAHAVSFDGVYLPNSYPTPEDGWTNENGYNHISEVRDIAGNVMNVLHAGSFQRQSGTLKIPYGTAGADQTALYALLAGATLSLAQIKTDGTREAATNWMIEDDPVITHNREYTMIALTIIKEPGITPA